MLKTTKQQESIPVEYVMPAFVVWGGMVYPFPQIPGYPTPLDAQPPGYPTTSGRDMRPEIPPPPKGYGTSDQGTRKAPGTRDTLPISPLPVDRMTDSCENITFSQLRWMAVII